MKSKYNAEGDGEYVLRFTDEEFRWFRDAVCDWLEEEHPEIVRVLDEAYVRGVDTGDLCAQWFDHGELGLSEVEENQQVT